MAFVITNKCLGEQYAQCVGACPVDCIYPGTYKNELFMVIDPEICINCSACLPVCPVLAIVEKEEEAPEWAEINKQLAPEFKDNPQPEPREINSPPRKPENQVKPQTNS